MNVRHDLCYPLGDKQQLSKKPRANGCRRTGLCKNLDVSNIMIILLVQDRYIYQSSAECKGETGRGWSWVFWQGKDQEEFLSSWRFWTASQMGSHWKVRAHVQPCNKYLLSTYYVPATNQGDGDSMVNKTYNNPGIYALITPFFPHWPWGLQTMFLLPLEGRDKVLPSSIS